MSKLEAMLEAERRGILPADKRPLLDEARRRGLIGPIGPQPERESPGVAGYAADIGEQAVRGFNKGLVGVLTAPYRAIDWAAEKITGGQGLPDVETMPLYQPFLDQPEARTTPGRYAAKAGEAAGASAIPTTALVAKAPALAALAPTTAPRAIGQTVGQNVAAAPGTAAAVDLASAATSGLGVQAAQDMGYGPAGQAMAGMVAGIIPGVGMAYLNPASAPIGTPTGNTVAARRAAEAATDAQAFDDLNVRQFGPAYNQGPVASVAKQLSETPIVGAPLRNNLDETFMDAATAARTVSDQISPNAMPETAGLAVQRGLDRFRDSGFTDLEPGQVQALGINPNSPVQRPQGGGQAQIARIQQNQPIINQATNGTVQNTRGQAVPLPQTRAQRLTTRTTVEDLSDAELNRLVRTPADNTSFSTRLEALYERANRGTPTLYRSNGSIDPITVPTSNAGQVVRQLVGDEARTGVRAGLQGRYGDMFNRLADPRSNITIQDLRSMRTAIGRDLSNFGMYEASLDRTQLRRLYASLSSDIEIGMQDAAARAARNYAAGGPNAPTAAQVRRAVQALRDTQVADRYARAGFERMDRFLQIVRAPNPQQAAASLIRAAADGGRGNMRMVRAAMSVLRPEERAQFGALIINELGRPVPSARGIVQESGFSPSSFVTRYQSLSPEARNLVFTPQHQQALERLFRVANRLANVEALANTSRSGTNALNLGGGAAALGSVASGNVVTPIAIGVGGAATSFLMSSPRYTRWMIRYMQLRANVRSGADRSVAPLLRHVAGLTNEARANPQLAAVIASIVEEVDELGGDGARLDRRQPAPIQ